MVSAIGFGGSHFAKPGLTARNPDWLGGDILAIAQLAPKNGG
jgi:hypothetical protein